MNDRRKELLNLLVNSNVWLSGRECGEILDVSDRTIRSDIKVINQSLKEFDIQIVSDRNKGYRLSEESKLIYLKNLQKIDFMNDESPIPKTPKEREDYILYRLVFTDTFLTMEDLANDLYVSKTTIYLDVRRLLERLAHYSEAEIIISNTDGLRIEGSEYGKRQLISNTLKSVNYYTLDLDKSLYYALSWTKCEVEDEMLSLYELLLNTLNEYECSMVDRDIVLFTKEIYISIKRIREEKFVDKLSMPDQFVMNVVKDLITKVEEKYLIRFPEYEKIYLQLCFNSKRLLSLGKQEINTGEEGQEIVDSFIERVKLEYNIDLSESENFVKNMNLHMGPMLSRLRSNIVEESPIIDQIQKKYPFAYEISTRITPIIEEQTGFLINETELTYISLHVAVSLNNIFKKKDILIVCGSGYATAKLIKNEILSRYNTYINKIKHISYSEFEAMNEIEADLVVSTVPLTRKHIAKPILMVNPVLNFQDIANLDSIIKKECNVDEKDRIELMKYMPRSLFTSEEALDSFELILKKMARKLKISKLIDSEKDFYQSVIERENLYSTILDNGIAIPHPMTSMAKTTVVAVTLLPKEIEYKGKKVSSILLFAINSSESDKLNRLYAYLETIVESDSLSKQFRHITDYDDYIDAIVREDVRA